MKKFLRFLGNFLFGRVHCAVLLEVVAVEKQTGVVFVKKGCGYVGFLQKQADSSELSVKECFIGEKQGVLTVRKLQYNPDGDYEVERICCSKHRWIVRFSEKGGGFGYGVMKVKGRDLPPRLCRGELVGYTTIPMFREID